MWDCRLRVVIGEHYIEFYFKKIRKCFIDNYKLKKEKGKQKEKEKKNRIKKKGQNRTQTGSVHTKVKSPTTEPHSKLGNIG